MENELPISLFVHFIGFGLFVTTVVASYILEMRFAKADTFDKKLVVLGIARSFGILSPIASLIILITGIGNMHALGYGLLTVGWLTAKIFFFVIALVSGVLFSIQSRKRAKLVALMAQGNAPADADAILKSHSNQIRLYMIVLPLLLIIIVALAVYGVHGGGSYTTQ